MGLLVLMALSAWQILYSYCCFLFSPVSGLVLFSSWQEHPDGPWIRFIACHFRGCQSSLWPEVGPTFRERTTHFGLCLGVFCTKKALLHWERVWIKKKNSFISLFKAWLSCLPSREGFSVVMWCGRTHRADLNLLPAVRGGVDNAAPWTVLMNCPFVSRWAILDCYLGGGYTKQKNGPSLTSKCRELKSKLSLSEFGSLFWYVSPRSQRIVIALSLVEVLAVSLSNVCIVIW